MPERRFPTDAGAALSMFEWLVGSWSFVREIPGYASATGEAQVWLTGEDCARYEETAQTTLVSGERLTGRQCYLYRRVAGGVGFDILFCDTGELFERLEFAEDGQGGLCASARHLCGADVYDSEYRLDREGRFHTRHTVRGPRKDYGVETLYRRATP